MGEKRDEARGEGKEGVEYGGIEEREGEEV